MRLVELTVRNFRGFGANSDTIKLDRDLVLIYGPNGFGKTSIAEAVEWLFYGFTKRRVLGEGFSKAEYAGTYANVHNGKPVQVEAKVSIAGTEYTLTRRLVDGKGEVTQTFIDGAPASFASIDAVGSEAVYPVVSQHGLQTFIHTKPKDRRDAIGAALGLDELTAFKSALESARGSFQRLPPTSIVNARKGLAANLPTLTLLPDAAPLVTRWQRSPMQIQAAEDIRILLKIAAGLCGVPVTTPEAALGALRSKRVEASRAVFDASKIAPAPTAPNDAVAFTDAASAARTAFQEFEQALNGAIAALAATYSAALLDFWTKGLTIAPTGDTCPMCDASTLTQPRRDELRKRIADGTAAIASERTFVAKTSALGTSTSTLLSSAGKCCPRGLTPVDRPLLRTLVAGSDAELDAFLTAHDELFSAKHGLERAAKDAQEYLQRVPSSISKGTNAPKLLAYVAVAQVGLKEAETTFARAVEVYHQQWPAFETLLSARISTQDLVAKIDAIGKTLKLAPDMELHARYDAILAESQDLIRSVEQTLQTKQTLLLQTRGTEVKALYDLLNPGANVVFDSMEPGTDQIKLHATSFGVRMPAAANLSECQLNCLGLSVWVMQATTPGSPFGFIVLDDPVQSMDDDHSEALLASFIPHLINNCGKQVIVLSHVERITDRLRELNVGTPMRHYHLSQFLHSGPILVEQNRIAKTLSQIKTWSQGNNDNRESAMERLRELIELLIRELYLRERGIPMPSQYDKANPRTLLGIFRTLAVTTAQENAGLEDSIGFTDPSHHTEVGYTTPVATRIAPHINRVENLLRKYALLT
jgi:energy-coupling factor transporter ATP-binding protein EcfA2